MISSETLKGYAARLVASLVILVISACSHQSNRKDLDQVILDAANKGTSCPKADDMVKHSEDLGPDGYFHPLTSANRYYVAGVAYSFCADQSSHAPDQARFYLFAAIADDQAYVRFLDVSQPTFAKDAIGYAHEEVQSAGKRFATLPSQTPDYYREAQLVIDQDYDSAQRGMSPAP